MFPPYKAIRKNQGDINLPVDAPGPMDMAIPQIERPRAPMPANVGNAQVAVDTLLKATGGDFRSTNPQAEDWTSASHNPAFWGDSAVNQANRARFGAEQETELDQDTLDVEAARGAARMSRLQPQMEDSGDMASERAAGRQLMPNARAVYGRNRGAAREDAYSRYQVPAEIQGAADIEGANITGNSRIRAAQQSRFDPRQGVLDALSRVAGAQIGAKGSKGKMDQNELAMILEFLNKSAGVQ